MSQHSLPRRRCLSACLALLCLSGAAHAQLAGNEADEGIEEIIVIGTAQDRYRVEDSAALTGFRLDFLELPRVVNVIPEQLILDQKITDLGEALRNVPGVSTSDGFGGTNDDFLIRGFRRNVVYRNGFRRDTNLKTNTTNVEAIQVIRGPASITYGQVEPGGLVDIVTKRPLPERRLAAEARYGSYDDRLLLVDWSEPLGDRVGVRVVASTQDANSFRDFTDIKRDTVALSSRFALTDSTEFTAAYEYRDESRPLDRGTVTVATPTGREIVNNLIDLPISRRFGEPFEIYETEFHFAELGLRHEFINGWSVNLGAAYEDSLANDLQARPAATVIFDADAPIGPDGFFTGAAIPQPVFDDPSDQVFLVRRTDGSRERDSEVLYLDAIVSGEVETGSIRHRIALGADYRDQEQTRFFVTTPLTNGIPRELGGRGPLFNLRNPIYGTIPDTLSTAGRPLIEAREESYGAFINDYVDVTDQLGVLVGVRWDEVDGDAGGPLEPTDNVSPQVAVSYRVNPAASVFASYAESFQPNSAADPDSGENIPFDPETSDQIELGAKLELFEGRVQTTAALYRIEKSNVLGEANGVPALVDGQRSQGLELSVVGQPVQGMNVFAGYAYTDAEILSGPTQGNRPTNVAEHTANLWVSYEWQEGMLQGVGLGGGVFYTSDRYGDDANSWKLGDYALVDLSAWYTLPVAFGGQDGTTRLQLSVKNLFDEEYFPASGGDERVSIGTPRTFFASLSATF